MTQPTSPTTARRAMDFPVDYIHGCGSVIVRWYFRFTARLRIYYGGPVPRGGFLIVCNHRSFLDPLALGCTLRRRIHYFARSSLWKIAPVRWALDLFGGIPVNRSQPQSATITSTVTVLRQGRMLLMFPEGTRCRNGRLGQLRDGPALIARRAGVPIVPVYLDSTESSWPRGCPLPIPGRGKVGIHFGPPLWANKDLAPRQQDADLTLRVQRWLLQQEIRSRGPLPPEGEPASKVTAPSTHALASAV